MAVHSTRRLITRGALGALLAILASGIGSAVLAADHAVDIAGFAFSPGTVTVAVGDTVTWTNADAQGHTATADDGSFDTGTIAGNASASQTFSTARTFAYHCKIHPQMTATIVVAAAAPATDTVAVDQTAGTSSDGRAGWAVLAIAAIAGLVIGRRRFGRPAEAAISD